MILEVSELNSVVPAGTCGAEERLRLNVSMQQFEAEDALSAIWDPFGGKLFMKVVGGKGFDMVERGVRAGLEDKPQTGGGT